MRIVKFLIIAVIFSFAAFTIIGCSSSSSGGGSSKTMSNIEAQAYSQMGNNLSQDITGAIIDWAESGSITGLSASGAVKGSSLSTATVTDEGGGWFHLTETTFESGVSFEADLHGKLDKNGSGEVVGVWVYGTLAMTINTTSDSYVYEMTYGNGIADPYHGTITRTGATIDAVSVVGASHFAIDVTTIAGSVAVSMDYSYNLSLPVTSGSDYPTGTITITNVKRAGVAQPDITITFDGDSSGTISFGSDYTTTFYIIGS